MEIRYGRLTLAALAVLAILFAVPGHN
jgi:hypothetical protein